MKWIWILALLSTFLATPLTSVADQDHYALIAKSVDDENFVDAWLGCQEEALKFSDTCTLLGGEGPANPHTQYSAIEQALASKHYAALAISVTKPEFINSALAGVNIPVLTFDSPFTDALSDASLGYIGPDNQVIGADLALIAQKLLPQGGSLCIFTAIHDPNLQQRVAGVRKTLSKSIIHPNDQKLTGEHGWVEADRCPLNTGDNPRQTMDQMDAFLSEIHADMLISVGHWPIINADLFRKTTYPYRHDLKTRKTHIVVATGKVQSSYTDLLSDQLIHGLVSIDFKEIGRMTYLRMRQAHKGEPIPKVTYTQNYVLTLEAQTQK
jgi:ribose transport system substrate-binding protein